MQASSFLTSNHFFIAVKKQSQYRKRQLSLQYGFGSGLRSLRVLVDYQTNTAKIRDKNETLLSLAGKGSFQEVDFINADGECIGCGSYKELPNMPAASSVGLDRTYNIYKSNNHGSVARFHQVHYLKWSKNIRLYIDQPELDSLTRILLVGKLVMMALLDPGFLHLQSDHPNESQCITKIAANHILPNFVLPDWDYPAQLRMRIVGTIMGEKEKKDYYALFDPFGEPWYIMETNNSTELKVLDPVTYQPLLIGDNAASIDELCTITTPDNIVIGKLENRKVFLHFDNGFRRVYKFEFGAESKIGSFRANSDYRYKQKAKICKCNENLLDKNEMAITLYLHPHRLGLAVLPPVLCIFASQTHQMMNIQVPVSQSIEDLCFELKGVQV